MAGKIKEIINGWQNVFITDEVIESMAEKRLKVCNECTFKNKIIGIEICGKCHCPIVAKIRSIESICPENKWITENKK